jgi:hypothetical protein
MGFLTFNITTFLGLKWAEDDDCCEDAEDGDQEDHPIATIAWIVAAVIAAIVVVSNVVCPSRLPGGTTILAS